MPACLTIYFSDRPARFFTAERNGEYLVGRDPASDVLIDDARVSRRHAMLVLGREGASIRDLDSKNGLAVDGRLVEAEPLPEVCWISVGGLMVHFDTTPGAAERAAGTARRRETLHGHQALADPDLGIGGLVEKLLESFLGVSRTTRGFVLLGDGRRFEVVASRALSAEAAGSREFSGSLSTVEEVLAGGGPVVHSDAQAGDLRSLRPSVVRGGIRALVCVPLCAAGRTLGAVYGDSSEPSTTFDELDLEILTALAGHAAVAMWAAGLRRELDGLARALPTRESRRVGSLEALEGFPSWTVTQGEGRPGARP